MRKLITLSILCFATAFGSLVSNAQQLPRYTQYMFNKTVQSAENTDGKTAWIRFDCDKKRNCLSLNDVMYSEKKSFGLGSYDAFILKKSQADKLGFTHHRLQQTYKNIPIIGADFIIHTKNEKAKTANGFLVKNLELNTTPNLTETQALQAALQMMEGKKYAWEDETYEKILQDTKGDATASFFPKAELVIVSPYGKDRAENYRLAYRFDVYSIEPLNRLNVFVDANNAEIVTTHSLLTDADLACTGETNYSCNNPVNMTCDDSNAPNSYALHDNARNITTYTSNNTNSFPNDIVTEGDTHFDTDKTASDVHYNTSQTYEYFLNEHGLDGFDNNHTHIRSWTHYHNNYVNAFWNGSWLTYGDGNGTSYFPLTSLDIVAHEFGHAITHHSASLVYAYESGALNESFSDIFGAALEFYVEGACADWLLGEDITANNLGFRSLENPNARNHPDTYLGDYWYAGSGDNGGVHINSGVQNYWFYLLSNGGNGTNDNGDSYNVAGIGIEKATAIAFRNLTAYLGSNDGFVDARNGSIQAATDLYGANSVEVMQVCEAWAAVGVGACSANNAEITVVAPNGGEVLNENTAYTISWTNTGTVSNVNIAYTINGSNFIDIATDVANTGSYIWNVPDVCSELVRVKVTDVNDAIVSDVSDADFEIVCCEVVAGFTYDGNIVNTPITFSNTSASATTYEWQIDGVTQSTSLDFTHTFANEGNYLVTLIADDGTCTDIYSQMINVYSSCYNRYVATTGNNNNTGEASSPYADIQYAITQVCDGDTVFVNDGTYIENIDFLGKNIVVTSINGAASTTIDGNQNGSVVVFQNGETDAVLNGFTVTNGSGSLAQYLSNSSFYNYGGGVLIYLGATPTLQNLIVENNNAERGGGICVIRGWQTTNIVTIQNCEIKNNNSGGSGGGILAIGGVKVNIINSLIAKNHSNLRGGGLKVNYTSEAIIINSTIADNTASSNGGNIARANEARFHATNCIITGSNNQNIYWTGGTTAQSTISYSNIEGGQVGTNITWGAGNIDADPLFTDAINGDYSLQAGSPCIDTATATDAPSTDINGVSRPQGLGVDMGAYEHGFFPEISQICGNEGTDEELTDIVATNDGGSIAVGNATINDVNGTHTDIYVLKLDASGNKEWEKRYGTTAQEDAFNIVQTTPDNGYLITGTTNANEVNKQDVYLLKIDENGALEWLNHLEASENAPGRGKSVQTQDGGFITMIRGNSVGTIQNKYAFYFVKTTFSGQIEWTKLYSGTNNQWGNHILQTQDGGYIFSGTSASNPNFGYHDIIITKLDNSGNMVWSKNIGTTHNDLNASLVEDNDGNLIVTGNTGTTLGYTPNEYKAHIIKLSDAGSLIWHKQYNTLASRMQVNNNYLYFIGRNKDDNGIISTSLLKIDNNGNLIWAKTYGKIGFNFHVNSLRFQGNKYLMAGSTNSLNGNDNDYFLKTGNVNGIDDDNCFALTNSIIEENFTPNITDFALGTPTSHDISTSSTLLVYDYNIACNNLCEDNEVQCNATDLNLPTEIILCDSTSTTISANLPNMSYYIWDFEGLNIGTTEEITVTENGWYYLSVADSCGNAAIDSVYVLLDDNCVWPGDFNYDNVTNYLDLLDWSVAYGQTGAMRPNASFNWEGQPCEDWNSTHTDGVNHKHADADGNGIVDLNDPSAIIANYSETHGLLPPPLALVESPISLTSQVNEPSYLSFNGSTTVRIDLDLRNNNGIDVVFNRMGFQVFYDFGGGILSNIELHLNENWVGTNVKTLVKDFPQEQRIDVALARYDGQNVTGDGYLGYIIAVVDNVTPFDGLSLNLGLGNVDGIKMQLNDGTDIPVGWSDTDFDIPVLCPWKVQNETICSNTNTFWVAVNAEEALENCIGAEFNLSLPAGIQTTGNYTFGELALNAVNNDESQLGAFVFDEYVTFYFDGSSASNVALNGSGTLLYIELENTNAISDTYEIGINGNVIESYALGYEEICADSGTIEIEMQSGSYGNLFVWNDATNPLTGNNPSITNITPINNAAATVTPLDTNGRFGIDGDTQCKLTRYGGCIPLSPVVGGLDATRILSILTNGIVPTTEQLLAADVNEDGAVTAGDLTAVGRRSTGNLCSYPTQAGQDISDWKFIPTDIFLNDAAYANATNFDVPVPLQIVNFDAVPDSLCYNEKDFVAILKGDVTNNWNSSYAFKTGNLGEIVIDLANISATENNTYHIPIFYDGSENINAIDLNVAFDASQINILDVVKTQSANDLDIMTEWNVLNENDFYFMAASLVEIPANTPLFYIEIQTLNNNISANTFGESHVYLNELETDVIFSTNNSVGIFTGTNLEHSFSIYPNPAKNKAVVYLNEMAKATTFNLYDIAGKKVGTYDVEAHATQLAIDLNDIQTGLYLLEWNTETDILAKQKLVVIK